MRTVEGDGWKRGGLSLLWGPEALGEIAKPAEVASIRDLFKLSRSWPEDLPSNTGQTLVVAGVEGCLDCLTPEDAAEWIEVDLRPVLLSFQEEYEIASDCAGRSWRCGQDRRWLEGSSKLVARRSCHTERRASQFRLATRIA